jgi:hypothetical protein
MSPETLALLDRLSAASTVDWLSTRKELHELHKQATTSEERGAILAIYAAVMNLAEGSDAVNDLEEFKKTREQDYNLFLVREAADAAGNIVPEVLLAVTEREVAAGRMAETDGMRQLALSGRQFIEEPEKPSLWSKARSIFGKRS